jgi:hypothetical protein
LGRSGDQQGQIISIKQYTYQNCTKVHATLRGPVLKPPLHTIINMPNSRGGRGRPA